tara:strand:- start:16476 stop:18200 length:1725 start_codon:yes stop_codon:yes gene_type:complete
MTLTLPPKFTDAEPVIPEKAPIVLRLAGLWPHQLRRFKFHDERRGGDLVHVDLDLTKGNACLVGDETWDQVIRDEIEAMKLHNFEQQVAALEEKSRCAEARKVEAEGPVDPWRVRKEGPLREGILTVNKEWFGGSGQSKWEPSKVEEFRQTAMKFLRKQFPNGQLRYASAHLDEEALHIHFIVVTWVEKPSTNRGFQILLQPSANPLIADYELAQDLAGEAFAEIGIARGERRAEARRQARAEGKPLPDKRKHVAPSKWRAEERRKAQDEKKHILSTAENAATVAVEDGRDLAKATVRKSRKRAIKEAQARKLRAAKEAAKAARRRDAAEVEAQQFEKAAAAASSMKKGIEAEIEAMEPRVKVYEERAVEAAEKFRRMQEARKVEEENLARINREKEQVNQGLIALHRRKVELHGQVQRLAEQRNYEEAAGASAHSARMVEETKLEEAAAKVRLKVAEAEVIAESIETGLGLVADGALVWRAGSSDKKQRLSWGSAAPVDNHVRKEKLKEIRPAMRMVARIARLVTKTVARVLAKERQELKKEAEYVRGLRAQWEPEVEARLSRISRGPDDVLM